MTSVCGRNRVHIASMAGTPALRAASTTSAASAAFLVKGFSTSTGLPAAMASRAWAAMLAVRRGHIDGVDLGVGDQLLVGAVGTSIPNRSAKACARSGEREPTATSRCRVCRVTARRRMTRRYCREPARPSAAVGQPSGRGCGRREGRSGSRSRRDAAMGRLRPRAVRRAPAERDRGSFADWLAAVGVGSGVRPTPPFIAASIRDTPDPTCGGARRTRTPTCMFIVAEGSARFDVGRGRQEGTRCESGTAPQR